MKAVNVRVIGEKENESKNRDGFQNANIVEFGNPCVFFGKFDNPDYDFQTCEVASYHMQYFYRFEMKKS